MKSIDFKQIRWIVVNNVIFKNILKVINISKMGGKRQFPIKKNDPLPHYH